MITEILDRAIRGMCEEIETSSTSVSWKTLDEDDLLFEIAVCIVSSQMIYEMAVEVVRRIRAQSLLVPRRKPTPSWKVGMSIALAEPVNFNFSGTARKSLPRFKNRITHLLANTLENIYKEDQSIRAVLATSKTPEHARRKLIEIVSGFGPKQASLFLRRVGFSQDLAVLDTHILDYMRIQTGKLIGTSALSTLNKYEEIEAGFRVQAQRFGYDVGCVDLATWITMRVAKREAYI